MHQALYRKWRPKVFDDVYGQEHITSVLKYEAQNSKLSHAYLFCGSRGVGKTTCAKILAKAVNCLNPVDGEPCGKCEACLAIESGSATDVLEMDAASNNGVEHIRDIRDEVVYAPSQLKYRVYIIDEVHMLSQSAFNALLKTLEEPPSYVIFILATTEQHKLPATIISRCQNFEFRRISTDKLSARIMLIAKEEGISLEPSAAHLISRLAQGGMRDAISLLELCAGNNDVITEELVNNTVGSTGRERTSKIATAVAHKNYDAIFDEIAELIISSKSIGVFWQDLISFWRDMLIFKTSDNAAKYLDLTDAETERLSEISSYFTRETLLWHCRLLDEALPKIAKSPANARMSAELTLLRMCDEKLDTRTDSLLSRIAKLEEKLITGNFTVQASPTNASPVSVAEESNGVKLEDVKEKKTVKAEKKEEPIKEAPEVKPSLQEAKKPEIKSEIKKEESKAAPVQAQKSESPKGTRVLRPLRCWVEILDEMSVTDIFLWIDINTAKAFTDENQNVVIVFESEFALKRSDKPETKARVSELLSLQLERKVEVSFEYLPPNTDSYTVIDEILNDFNEQ